MQWKHDNENILLNIFIKFLIFKNVIFLFFKYMMEFNLFFFVYALSRLFLNNKQLIGQLI